MKNAWVLEHPLYNHELACPIFFPKFQITFILIGYPPSRQVLPYRPSESVLGTSNAQTNSGRRCSVNDRSGCHIHLSIQLFPTLFLGHGILGCTAIQVHEKIVTRQLQIIFHIVRQWVRSVQGFDSNKRLSRDVIGLASMAAPWVK